MVALPARLIRGQFDADPGYLHRQGSRYCIDAPSVDRQTPKPILEEVGEGGGGRDGMLSGEWSSSAPSATRRTPSIRIARPRQESAATRLPLRSKWVDAANAALPVLWASGCLRKPVFESEALLCRAREKTGLSDFGDQWFRRPFEVLIEAVREEAELNALGRLAAYGQFIKMLRDRLWTQQWVKDHPEILDHPLPPPVIVVGPMRSGTTRLHRLLAADQRFSHLRFFETVSPVPPPGLRSGQRDPRPREAQWILRAAHTANPLTALIHPTEVFAAEEELGLLVASAWGMKHEAQWNIPSYGRWSERQHPVEAYRHMAKLLRLVGWLRGEPARPWVLKTPQHMIDLRALMEVFPEARFVFIHRNPVNVVASSCSLSWNQAIIHSDQVDPGVIGQRWLHKTELQIGRRREGRQLIDPARAIDVRYDDMNRDWQGTMESIYRLLGMDISPALPAMRHYLKRSEIQRRKQQHRYALEDYGLEAGAVHERFSAYMEEHRFEGDKR